ncbi:MAG: YidC/Oxa1 family membrane protein insertase [Lachnospiraceae bacterium]|nr:YidC/Oxa1 family membrane protein insertase [Lachnospiraceae bacterium]
MILAFSWNPIVWIAELFGFVMDLIFKGVSAIGLPNIGLCIIIFTIVTKLILYPLTLKQSKSQKLQQVVQPEIAAIQAKYKGRENDQQAMMMQQAEIKAVYEKYGTSMTAGCLPLLIQFPIIFGLYKVIINIPDYVASVRVYFENIVNAIGGEAALSKINEFIVENDLVKVLSMARISGNEVTTTREAVNFLNKLSSVQWDLFINKFQSASAAITENLVTIQRMNNFLGIDLAATPSSYGLANPKAWIIPLLAGLSQFAASKLMQKQTDAASQGNQNDQSKMMMNSMNYMMPIMSVVFCFSFASGIGVYWIAQAVVSAVQQLYINKQMDKLDVNELIKVNLEKTNKKRAKKGLPPVNEKAAEENYRKMQKRMSKLEAKRNAAVEKSNELVRKSNEYYKTDTIADRARMVQQYNEKKGKKE